jgi:galactokinase
LSAAGAVIPGFAALFGRAPEVGARAPGRVNLIGEHTDYNAGYVLPIAIGLATRVELARRADDRVRAWSASIGDDPGALREFRVGAERRTGAWVDYVQGVTQALIAAGHAIAGFDLRVESDLPLGGGLASSAALEVSVLRGLRELFALDLDDLPLALLGQRAETDLVGAPVGVMDQVAASLGEARRALFLDTRSLELRPVPLPAGVELAVLDSGEAHDHARGDYRLRRAECERAARLLGVAALRDVDPRDLAPLERLPAPLDRRARHVVTENRRVLEAVDALGAGNVAEVGRIFRTSHDSMRDDFEISTPAIDLLVELAGDEPSIHGARLTGGGFGGAVVLLTRAGEGGEAARRIAATYGVSTGRRARLLFAG